MGVFWLLLLFGLFSGFFLSAWLPWWAFVPAAVLISFFLSNSGSRALLAGFMAIFLPWLAVAAYLDTLSDGRLTARVASIFNLEAPIILTFITAFLGGILGACGAWLGWLIKWAFRSRRR